MPYRICKTFTIESGHMLSKHPGLCRYPHGHSRTVEVIIAADQLDASDMVCDFKTIKLALSEYLANFDHAMVLNSQDPMVKQLAPLAKRVIVLEGVDPTTEVLAHKIFQFLKNELAAGKTYAERESATSYRFPSGLRLERVRVSETASTWAEYSE